MRRNGDGRDISGYEEVRKMAGKNSTKEKVFVLKYLTSIFSSVIFLFIFCRFVCRIVRVKATMYSWHRGIINFTIFQSLTYGVFLPIISNTFRNPKS